MMNREHLNSVALFVLLQSSTTKFLLTPFGIVESKVFLMPNCLSGVFGDIHLVIFSSPVFCLLV